jgi:hypothetical protein
MSGKIVGKSWARTVRKSLLELYSRSTSIWTGKEKADEDKDSSGDPVWYPTVSMLGIFDSDRILQRHHRRQFVGRLLARLTLIQATKRPNRREALIVA